MREIAVGDIHGKRIEMDRLIAAVRDRYAPEAVKFLFVGDLVDRGPESAAVISTVHDMCSSGEASCVLGNHDELFLQAVLLIRPDLVREAGLDPAPMEGLVADFRFAPQRLLSHWINQGGGETLRSYGAIPRNPDTWNVLPREHLYFLATLPLAHSGTAMDISHARAGAKAITEAIRHSSQPWEVPEPLRYQLLWNRDAPEDAPERLHVSGHTPREEPIRRHNTVEIDTGCVFGHRLTAFDPYDDTYLQIPCSMHPDE
jgi:diadenosine tetraphosphatase ApaH/serine/threonine PP2A family protein phosphatase